MQCRDVSETEFETIAADLEYAKTEGDDIELVTGHHRDLGRVVMLRDATRCMVLVEDPACLDLMRIGDDGAVLQRALRVGRSWSQ